MADAFESAAAEVLGNSESPPAAGAPGGAAPSTEPVKKRGRGRPPKHGRYSTKGGAAPADVPPVEPSPDVAIPAIDPAQLGVAVKGLLDRIAAKTATEAPTPSEAEALGNSLAYGVANTPALALESVGPWTPFVIAAGLYALPRGIELLFRYLDRRANAAVDLGDIPDGQRFRVLAPDATASESPATPVAPPPSTGVAARGAKVAR